MRAGACKRVCGAQDNTAVHVRYDGVEIMVYVHIAHTTLWCGPTCGRRRESARSTSVGTIVRRVGVRILQIKGGDLDLRATRHFVQYFAGNTSLGA